MLLLKKIVLEFLINLLTNKALPQHKEKQKKHKKEKGLLDIDTAIEIVSGDIAPDPLLGSVETSHDS